MKTYTKTSLRAAYKVVEEMMENDEVVRASYKNSFQTVLNIIAKEYIKIDVDENNLNF